MKDQNCPDCDAEVGQAHTQGCDVAPCKHCGKQDVSCNRCSLLRPSTIWRGAIPGEAEVAEYGLADLNELWTLIAQSEMRWDIETERWYRMEASTV